MRRVRYQFGTVQQKKRQRGPNVWVFRFTDEKGVKRSVNLGTIDELPRRADALHAAESLRLVVNADAPAVHGITFGAVIDRYIADEMPARYSTAKGYGAYLRAYIKPKWGDYQLNQIKPFAVEQWLKGLDLAPKTKGHILSLMRTLFNCAMRWEFIEIGRNPLSLVRVRGISKRQTKAQVLTAAQATQLIETIEPAVPFRLIAWLTLLLGLEPSAWAGLRWGDFDFSKLQVKIQRGVVEKHVDGVKNEYREAALPIDPRLASMLLCWRAQTQWNRPDDWVFASPYFAGQHPYNPQRVAERHLWPAAKKVGLGERMGWRSFRRTYSSLLRQLGVDVKVQQELMRHADIRTTMNLYTDSFAEDLREAHSLLVRQVLPERVM